MARCVVRLRIRQREPRRKPHGPAVTAVLTTWLAAIAAPAPLAAQTLQEALGMAYQTNPTIQAERARQRATRELTPQARANVLPQINAGGSYEVVTNDQTINNEFFGGVGSSTQSFDLNTLAGEVSGELPVFTGFRNWNAIRQARARVRAGGAQLAATEQNVILRAASAYFDVGRDSKVYASTANNVAVLARQLEEAQLRFEVGEITRTDVAQAEARLAGARAQLTSAQARLALSRATFVELVGETPGTLEESPALPVAPDTEEAAQALAVEYAPAVVEAREREKASRRQIAIARGVLSPQVSLTARYQYAEEPSTIVLTDEQFAYGVRASVPLFAGGANLSRIREAKATNEADRKRIIEAERRARAAVTQAFENLSAARANIASAEAQRTANVLALRGVRREAELGARTTLDVLDAEQELLDAEVSLANAVRDARVATFELLQAAGVLTLDGVDWEAPSPPLSPSEIPPVEPAPRR